MLKLTITCLSTFSVSAILCFGQPPAPTEVSPGWQLVEERAGITLFEWHEKTDSLRQFMAVFTIPADVHSCVKILYHDRFHTSFMDGMKSSELLKKHNEKSLCFYQVIDLPWPIPNRDMVTHADFDHTPNYSTVTVKLRSEPREKEATSMVRMNVPAREWSFARAEAGTTAVTYTYRYNPAGIPSLFEEMFAIDGPLKMMDRFRQVASDNNGSAATEVAWLRD